MKRTYKHRKMYKIRMFRARKPSKMISDITHSEHFLSIKHTKFGKPHRIKFSNMVVVNLSFNLEVFKLERLATFWYLANFVVVLTRTKESFPSQLMNIIHKVIETTKQMNNNIFKQSKTWWNSHLLVHKIKIIHEHWNPDLKND